MSRVTNLHAHIFTPAGAETGVVDHIQDWTLDDVLDGAGNWSLECWAKKENVDLLLAGRRVDVYGTPAGSEILLSSGSLDGQNPEVNKLGGSTFPVSGQTRIGELSDRTIVSLPMVEQTWMALGTNGAVRNIWLSSWQGVPHWWERNMVELYDGNPATSYPVVLSEVQSDWINYLYAGFDSIFDAIRATIHMANTYPGAHIRIQYNGPSGWAGVSNLVDGTIAGDTTMAQTGVISWTRPTDWIRSTVTMTSGSWYWVRMYVDVEWTSDLEITELEVYADQPTLMGLNLIMAYAPNGWKTGGYANTASTAYGEIKDMTVLAALRWLRDQIGGHFSSTKVDGVMRIIWIDAFADSGYAAYGANSLPDAADWFLDAGLALDNGLYLTVMDLVGAVRLLSMNPRIDRTEYASRIYPRATGVSLADTSRTATAPYVLDKVAGYIRNSVAETGIGRRDRAMSLPVDMPTTYNSLTLKQQYAADALFDKALLWLKQRDTIADFYTIRVREISEVLPPGQLIKVVTGTIVDGKAAHVVSSTFNVMTVGSSFDDGGELVAEMEISTIERGAVSDAQVLAGAVINSSRQAAGSSEGSSVASVAGGVADVFRIREGMIGAISDSNDGMLIDANGIGLNTATLDAANRIIRYFMTKFASDDVRQDAGSATGYAEMVQMYGIQGAAGWNLISTAFQRFFSGSWVDMAMPITIGVAQPGTTVLGGHIQIYGGGADDPTFDIIVRAPFGAGKKAILFDLPMEVRDNITITGVYNAPLKTPATGHDTGAQGDMCWDADYVYVCTATDTWSRSPITHW